MIVNTAQGGGGGVKLNLFAQPDEPPEKEGLWIQTPEKHAVKQITTKDSFVIGGSIRSVQDVGTGMIPGNLTHGYLLDGDDLYYVDKQGKSKDTSINLYIRKYNFVTNTTASVPLYNTDYSSTNFYGINYSVVYKKDDGNIGIGFSGDYHDTQYTAKVGSFNPNSFSSLNKIDMAMNGSASTIFGTLQFNPSVAKNNDFFTAVQFFYDDAYFYNFWLVNLKTNTETRIDNGYDSSYHYWQAGGLIYDNVLYYWVVLIGSSDPVSISAVKSYDLSSGQESWLNVSSASASYPINGIYLLHAYQNKWRSQVRCRT